MRPKFSTWDFLALGGGLAAGIFATRMLTPVLAQTRGTVRSRFAGDPFELLVRDHRRLLSLLHQMEHVPAEESARRLKLLLQFKRRFAKHALAEEDVVYPLLHDKANEEARANSLYEEHARMKVHAYRLEELARDRADWSGEIRSLRTMVEEHMRAEEDVEFPKLRRVLDAARTRKLSGSVYREEAMVL